MRRGLIALYVLMLSLAAINYADRVVLSVAAPTIAAEFHISTVTLGYFLSCFLWSYAACLILWGFAVDRVGPRATTAIGLTIWSVATITTGFCTTLPMLFASRLRHGCRRGQLVPVDRAIGAGVGAGGPACAVPHDREYRELRRSGIGIGVFCLGCEPLWLAGRLFRHGRSRVGVAACLGDLVPSAGRGRR